MLYPEERRALGPDARRTLQRWSILGVVTVLLTALPVWVWAGQPGPREHLLGRSEAQTVEVVSIEHRRACSNRDRYLWRVEAVPVSGQSADPVVWERCYPMGMLDEGDVMDVWITDSGFVAEHSAVTDRALFGGSVLGIIVLVLGLGALGARREKRLRRLVLEAGDGTFGDPISVVVEQDEKKRRWEIRPVADGSELAGYDTRFQPALAPSPHSDAAPVVGGAPETGRWELRLSSSGDDKHRIGLLTRGDQRSWIMLTARSHGAGTARR